MRLTIRKEEFLKALNAVGRAIPAKSASPVLTNFMLCLNEKGLEVTGTNGDLSVRCTIPYMKDGHDIIRNYDIGSTLVSARFLTEITRKLDSDELALEVVDDTTLKIDNSKSSYRLQCESAEDYPNVDFSATGTLLTLNGMQFSELVEQSAFAASNKPGVRPFLTAVNLEAWAEPNGKNYLTATATDSARLARKSIVIEDEARFRVNIPAKLLLDVVALLEGVNDVEIAISERKALFASGNLVITTRVITDDYPVTRSIIPQTFNYFLEVNAQELLSAMDRVAILSAEKESVVKLSMRDDSLEVSVRNETNGSAVEKIETFQYTGERLDVSFNSTFAVEAIKALKSEDVTICFQAEMKPFVIKNPKDDSVIELITPMRTY